ncbi:DREPP domain-containing protein [Cephalotus follicularis]|uniref:DREPP domain-containing protein n=1 Tax=Cephalotus follicularis TaxID=3775 RepID=A0A1Q3CJ05_CEPFO|nr:DREPP domain-containing protein [Cephalotus follicularis]
MTGYWKNKLLPKIKKVFEKNGTKKAAAEASKSFEESKEVINKEFEEKKTDLYPKVLEIYEASSVEIKALVKEPKEAGLKKHSIQVQKFIEELVKIDFPGSKAVSEASTKFGPALVPGPVIFVLEKVSSFIVVEEKEEAAPTGEGTSSKEKEIEIEEEKKEEVVVETEKTEPPPTEAAPEPTKVEEPEPPKP